MGSESWSFSGGATAPLDAISDVLFQNVQNLIVSSGPGNEEIVADGTLVGGTAAIYPWAIQIYGGPGNDTLTGSSTTGVDILIGGNGTANTGDGNDTFAGPRATVDYSARTSALTVEIDSTGVSAGSGDITGTLVTLHPVTPNASVGGTIGAPATGQSIVTGLVNMSAAAVGHVLVLSSTAGGTDDGAYKIVSCSTGSTCVIDVSGNPAFVADATNAFSCAETAHARTAQPSTASAGTITASTSTITGLAHISSHSVGHYLVISGSTMSLDDSGAGGYRIATETLNVDEADLVKAANVIGSATAINTITVAAAGSGAHRITGGSAADLLSGGAGVDTINGMAGNDTTVAMVVREHGILAQAFPSPGPEQHGRRSTGTLSRLRTARPKSAVWCECRRPILAASFTVPEREACSFSLCSI